MDTGTAGENTVISIYTVFATGKFKIVSFEPVLNDTPNVAPAESSTYRSASETPERNVVVINVGALSVIENISV